MKTHNIKTLTAELLIVEAKDDNTAWVIVFQKYGARAVADYTLLGKPDEISEEDAVELVEDDAKDKWGNPRGYKDYQDLNYYHDTANESLLSLIESKIYWENPIPKPDNYNLWAKYGDYTQYGVGLTTESLKWYKAEQKTFDRNRTLIFKKNN